MTSETTWVYDDGGRADAGYKGTTGDCAVRAVAIATGIPYQQIYDRINFVAKRERLTKKHPQRSNARTGVWPKTMHRLMVEELNWVWVPVMGVGTGTTVHLRADEMPLGRLVVRLSHHYAAMIDGLIRDTHDPSRDGTRCVYGYWKIS